MIRLVRKSSLGGHPITVRFDAPTLADFGKLTAASILDNIKSQKQADGSPLQMNAPSTRETKRKLGLPQLSLVFKKHRFVKGSGQSWASKVDVKGNRVSTRPADMEIATISRELQRRGYLGWIGINARTREAIRARVRQFIREAIKKATSTPRTVKT